MRRQVALVALATTSLLLIAFLVPLGLLVRTLAADRAAGAAQQEAQALVPVVASSVRDPAELTLVLQRVNSGTPRRVTVFLPDGRRVGALTQPGPSLALARQGRAFSTTVPGGRQILQPVLTTGGTAVITSFVPSALLSRSSPRVDGARPARAGAAGRVGPRRRPAGPRCRPADVGARGGLDAARRR